MNYSNLPPPFVVGQKYRDREGDYTVIAINKQRITIERPDGHRTIEDGTMKARIHRNVIHDAGVGSGRARRSRKRGEPSRREELIDRILKLEMDKAEHSGVEIDRVLAGSAPALGYSEEDVFKPATGRSVFGNDGDWAKAQMTAERWHKVVGTTTYSEGDTRGKCNVYRITEAGLDELRRRS